MPKNISRYKLETKNINTTHIFFQMTCIRKSKNMWLVRCMIEYKYHIIGEFKTEKEAILAYNQYIINHKLNRKLKNINTL